MTKFRFFIMSVAILCVGKAYAEDKIYAKKQDYVACYAEIYLKGIRSAQGQSSETVSFDTRFAKMGGAFGVGALAVRTCDEVIRRKGFYRANEAHAALLQFGSFLEKENLWIKEECLKIPKCRDVYLKANALTSESLAP